MAGQQGHNITENGIGVRNLLKVTPIMGLLGLMDQLSHKRRKLKSRVTKRELNSEQTTQRSVGDGLSAVGLPFIVRLLDSLEKDVFTFFT